MDNPHRKLAPISNKSWEQIEEEARRTLKCHLAARRVVDVDGPKGAEFSAASTGHLKQIAGLGRGASVFSRASKADASRVAPNASPLGND